MQRRHIEPPELILDTAALSARRPIAGLSKALALTSVAAIVLVILT